MSKEKITKFSEYNEGLSSMASKARRVVTGQSAGDEIQKLSQNQQDKLTNLYREDPQEAAKYLRSIIVKEKNSQFGLGLALTIAGAGMIYKANQFVEPPPPPPPPPPDVELYTIKAGDSWWKVASEHLPSDASNKDILAYAKQLASENGAEHLYSGKYGSPGLKPDTWTDLETGQIVSKKVLTDADKLFPGEEIKLPDFKK